MSDWTYRVAPNVTVTLRASRKPALLSRCLGDAVDAVDKPAVTLDLTGAANAAQLISGRYKGIPWRCGISTASGGALTVSWHSALLREYLALHVALLPALRRLLIERDVALVLGAAFELDGSATVLAGETGTGKTAAALSALSAGASLIGDEYVAISAAGDVTPVLCVIGLRHSTLASAPALGRHLPARRRLSLRAAALASRLTLGRLDPLVHVSPAELGIENVVGSAHLSTLLWLSRDASTERAAMDTAAAVDALTGMQVNHDRAFGVPDAFAFDTRHWRDVLSRGLRGATCLRGAAPSGALSADAHTRDAFAGRAR